MLRTERFIIITMLVAAPLWACGEDEVTAEADTVEAPSEEPTPAPSTETSKAEPAAAKPASPKAPAASTAPPAAPASPEEAALQARCDKAFDNLLRIMTEDGAPASILDKMKGQRDSQRKECMKTSTTDPSSSDMLDCMGNAKGQPELRACMDQHMNALKAKAEASGGAPSAQPPAAAPAAKPAAAPAAKPAAAPAAKPAATPSP